VSDDTSGVLGPAPDLSSGASFGRTILSGSLWTAFSFVLNKGVALASAVVLARLLEPKEYGIAALGLLVAAFAEILAEGGLGSAVVYVEGDDEVISNALSLAIVTGAATTLLGIASAPLLARAFGEADATPILFALSFIYVMSSPRHVYAGALARKLLFRKRVAPDVVRALVKATVAVVLAFAGFGAWSLVWGQLAGTAADLVAFVVVTRGRLRPSRLDRRVVRKITSYGTRLVAVGVIGVMLQNVDYVAVGARAGTEALGVYSIAFKVPELTLLALPYISSQVLFPFFVRLDTGVERGDSLERGLLAAIRGVTAIAVPLAVALALFAPEVVTGVFGDRWAPAGPILRALSIYGLLSALSFTFGDAIKARGRAGLLVRLGVVRLAVTVPVLWWAAGHGIESVAWAQVSIAAAHLVVVSILGLVTLRLQPGALARVYRVPAIAGSAMAGAGLLLRHLLATLPPLLVATLGGAALTTIYVAVTYVVDPAWVRSVLARGHSRDAQDASSHASARQ